MSTRRLRRVFVPAAALTIAGGLLGACSTGGPAASSALVAHAPAHSGDHSRGVSSPSRQVALSSTMRTLWDQHMQWTYDTVVAFATDAPGLQPTIDRLLRNQVDIGDAIAPFYGRTAANQLTGLLTTHIKDAVPVLTAAKAGDTAALDAAVADWYANATEIGRFLAKANPRWAGMPEMMKTHITQTIAYATDVLTGDHAKAIVDYDQAQGHMDEMADELSAGLVAQFHGRF
jgi:hypothetical protein